jgi:hypothetical protein
MSATNPLGRQKLFELYDNGKSAKALYATAFEAGRKVEWQLRRIYRERNRIVHRASPSENIETLIQTLNSYTLAIFEVLVRVATRSSAARRLDDIFAEVRIMEEARQRKVAGLADMPLNDENVDIVLGPER